MSLLSTLQWREPLWLLLMLQPLLAPLLSGRLPTWLRRKRHSDANNWVDTKLQPWVLQPDPRHHSRLPDRHQLLTALAWLLLAIAAAGPRLPPINAAGNTIANRGAGQDLVLLVDASRSMHATDIHPSRLRRARIEIRELLQRVPAARVALLLYAGRPHVLVPPTTDHLALTSYLAQLDQIPLPTSGSNSADALQLALDTALKMQAQRHPAGQPTGQTNPAAAPDGERTPSAAVIWITDGDLPHSDTNNSTLNAIAARFHEQQLPLSILGLGTASGGSIPLTDGGWLQQQQRAVITRMDANALQQLAKAADGNFSLVQDDRSHWQQLYDHNIAARISPRLNDPQQLQWRELFPWALAPGLALLLIAGQYRRSRSHTADTLPMLLPAPILLTLTFGLSTPSPAQAADPPTLRQAWQLYQAGDYPKAIDAYANIRGYAARMGEASANYRSERFDNATSQFSQAVLLADSDTQRANALYNLGNSLFREGRYADAGEAFGDALRYNPTLDDSQFNLDLSLALHAAVSTEQRRQREGGLAGNNRMGGRIEGDVDPNDDNDVVSDGVSTMPAIIAALPQSPLGQGTNNILAQQLVARGLARAETHSQADSGDDLTPEQALRARQNLVQARLRMAELSGRQALLWKRLFEMEEGFPAPLDAPKPLPGVPPW